MNLAHELTAEIEKALEAIEPVRGHSTRYGVYDLVGTHLNEARAHLEVALYELPQRDVPLKAGGTKDLNMNTSAPTYEFSPCPHMTWPNPPCPFCKEDKEKIS